VKVVMGWCAAVSGLSQTSTIRAPGRLPLTVPACYAVLRRFGHLGPTWGIVYHAELQEAARRCV
jgi:hypothetical protein